MEGEIIPGSRAHGHGTDGSRFDAATRRRRDGLSENESMRVAGTGGGPVEEMDWGEGTIPIDGRREELSLLLGVRSGLAKETAVLSSVAGV